MLVEFWWWGIFFSEVFSFPFPMRNQPFSAEKLQNCSRQFSSKSREEN